MASWSNELLVLELLWPPDQTCLDLLCPWISISFQRWCTSKYVSLTLRIASSVQWGNSWLSLNKGIIETGLQECLQHHSQGQGAVSSSWTAPCLQPFRPFSVLFTIITLLGAIGLFSQQKESSRETLWGLSCFIYVYTTWVHCFGPNYLFFFLDDYTLRRGEGDIIYTTPNPSHWLPYYFVALEVLPKPQECFPWLFAMSLRTKVVRYTRCNVAQVHVNRNPVCWQTSG